MACNVAEQIPLAEKVLRTVIVYALIAVLFRLTGKRGLASMNPFDVVVIFLLSNVVQNAIIGNDTSLTGGIIGAVTLVAVNTGVNRLIAVSATAARVFDGHATAVICDSHPVAGHCGIWACGAASSTHRGAPAEARAVHRCRPREHKTREQLRSSPEGRAAGRDQIRCRRAHQPPAPDRDPAQRIPVNGQNPPGRPGHVTPAHSTARRKGTVADAP